MPKRLKPADFPQIPQPSIDSLRNAVIVPETEDKRWRCGVLDNTGAFCENSRTMISRTRFTTPPKMPADGMITDLPGRHLWGGVARLHFGHFLTETITRLWALDHLKTPVESVIFQPVYHRDVKTFLGRELKGLAELLCGDVPLKVYDTPQRVEELHVPSQGLGHLYWSRGTPEFRHFMRTRLEAAFEPNGPEKLYISRTGMEKLGRGIDQEEQIIEIMLKAGYTIFQPERYTIRQQAEYYRAARMVVGGDGSAFHFAAHLLQPGTKVGLIMRRHSPDVFNAIARQIDALGEVTLSTLHPLLAEDDAVEIPRINLFRLERALRRKGFI